MCDRLKKELPGKGCKVITPMDAVQLPRCGPGEEPQGHQRPVAEGEYPGAATAGENRIRISPAIYNNMEDIDRLLAAL